MSIVSIVSMVLATDWQQQTSLERRLGVDQLLIRVLKCSANETEFERSQVEFDCGKKALYLTLNINSCILNAY